MLVQVLQEAGATMGLNMQEIGDGDHPGGTAQKERWGMGQPSDQDAGFTPVEEGGRKAE